MREASVQSTAVEGQFEPRIEIVRKRLAAKFADRMQQTIAALPQMTGGDTASVEPVANAYRWVDEICGIASTIGFPSMGQSALACDALLSEPYRTKRGCRGRRWSS